MKTRNVAPIIWYDDRKRILLRHPGCDAGILQKNIIQRKNLLKKRALT